MKYLIYTLPLLIIALFAYLFFGMEQGAKNVDQSADTTQPTERVWEMKTDDQGGVVVKVTPQAFGGDVLEWRFGVVFETHSGSLDQDLMLSAALSDEKGNVYKPVAWEGAGPGGHHREGVLVFRAITPTPSSVALAFNNVGGVPERSFRWSMQ